MKSISRRDFLKGSAASAISLALLSGSQLAFADGEAEAAEVKADETLETPILIVGAGSAGMFAAYEASKAGAKVLVISNSPSANATNGASITGT